MSRRGFFFGAHSTFQLNSALSESLNNELRTKSRIVVLEFGARWCGLCRIIEPQLEVLKSSREFVSYKTFQLALIKFG